jgi:hypothetical protein
MGLMHLKGLLPDCSGWTIHNKDKIPDKLAMGQQLPSN